MNNENTLILAVAGQFSYAEFAGDVGIPYCQPENYYLNGCMYDVSVNPYATNTQKKDLTI